MILKSSFYGMLGFARRAGRLLMGSFSVDRGVKGGKVLLLLLDDGASDRTKKDIRNMCEYYDVRYIITQPQGMLASICGKEGLMVAGVTDAHFADRLWEQAYSDKSEV